MATAGSYDPTTPEESVGEATESILTVYDSTDITLQRADSSKGDVTIPVGSIPAQIVPSLAALSQTQTVEQRELTKDGSKFSFTSKEDAVVGKSEAEILIELIIVRGTIALEFYGNNNHTVEDIEPVTSNSYGKVGTIINTLIEDVNYINQLAVTVAQSGSSVDWQSFDPAATRAGTSLGKLNTLVANLETIIDNTTLKD